MKVADLLPLEITAPEETDAQILAALDFEQAARFLDLEDWIVSRLRRPVRELTVNLPLCRDDGAAVTLTGFRVQHCGTARPALGPVYLSPEMDLRRLRAVAMNLTWQMSLLELPFSGSAGAVVCDPKRMSERELRLAVTEYAAALHGVVGPTSDVLAPGEGCNEQTMAWMLAATARDAAHHPQSLAAVVGKPAVLWGIAEHHAAAAIGLAHLLQLVRGGSELTFAIQGFGPFAQALAQTLTANRAKLVAVADASGGLVDTHGLNAEALLAHAAGHGVLFGFPEAEAVANADVLACDCDLLLLDAAPQQITPAQAATVRARTVVEHVNGAITRTAEEMLAERGIGTVPFLLAGAGAAAASAVEWERNTHPTPAPFNPRSVEAYMENLYRRTERVAREREISLRCAAMIVAVERLAAQMRLLGRE
jgi:glutamate dehydrogenase (NAD(P)+)